MKMIEGSLTRQGDNDRGDRGFTIVELLIVIVIIGILAAITIVAYSGIQSRAVATTLKSDLKQASTVVEKDRVLTGNYPTSKDAGVGGANEGKGLKGSKDTVFQYSATVDSYCLTAQAKGQSYFYDSSAGAIEAGQCNTHNPPVASGGSGGGAIASGDPMQSMTQADCSAMAIYDGSNSSALVTLTDNRGGATRSYTVGKLADNKCWMLDNLKLGSATSAIVLTPTDTDVSSNFTLPRLYSGSDFAEVSLVDPKAYGPVPGDASSGATNYGYLYNWPAATAGESHATMPAGSGDAQHSICPKNWRLPTGSSAGEFADLDRAFGGSGSYQFSGPSIAKWQFTGPFRGVLAGSYFGGDQGYYGAAYLWSSSLTSDHSAYNARFLNDAVSPGGYTYARDAYGVRCLLS